MVYGIYISQKFTAYGQFVLVLSKTMRQGLHEPDNFWHHPISIRYDVCIIYNKIYVI